ncbi:MAG: response regulator transcription factor [Saprospiraceae bacterium]|nr:response regulator transcription factor [Saprospiraceae bacterium]
MSDFSATIVTGSHFQHKSVLSKFNKILDIESIIDFDHFVNGKTKHKFIIFFEISKEEFAKVGEFASASTPFAIIHSEIQFAVYAIRSGATDFLTYPFSEKELAAFGTRILDRLNTIASQEKITNKNYIIVKNDGKFHKIHFDLLDFFEARGDYVNIRGVGKKIMVHSTLKKIEDKLPKTHFVRVHRSFIVNIEKVISFDDNFVYLEAINIPLSKPFKENLLGNSIVM